MRRLYRFLSVLGDAKAAKRGAGSYARRTGRKAANREVNRALRRILRP